MRTYLLTEGVLELPSLAALARLLHGVTELRGRVLRLHFAKDLADRRRPAGGLTTDLAALASTALLRLLLAGLLLLAALLATLLSLANGHLFLLYAANLEENPGDLLP
jgi:hypothetical protein